MNIIAYDMGTGGIKASLYDASLKTLSKSFVEYQTYYPKDHFHEQDLNDWWQAIVLSTKRLLEDSSVLGRDIGCIALSGHSLVALPVDRDGQALLDRVPIWSDTRALEEVDDFFKAIDYDSWYMTTGNGFPPSCYSLFKIMWLKKHQTDIYNKTYKFIGSKDYINLKLTGNIYTDYSYASGTGAYDLLEKVMHSDFLNAAGLSPDLFPEIVSSHKIIGHLLPSIAKELGLQEGTPVACGGVDNACMALGAVGSKEGEIYASLGSSSWIPVNSKQPILDCKLRPYVFAHIQEDMFTSAFSIFAGGSSLRWAKDQLCNDWAESDHVYDLINESAAASPIGANNIFFNPSLAGGTSQDKSPNIRGSFIGLHLGTTRDDLLRAVMEGVALNLNNAITYLKDKTVVNDAILFCGGGSKSDFWMQIFADVFDMNIIKTSIDQDAASLGAAAIAARAMGLWDDYSFIPSLHRLESVRKPKEENVHTYRALSTKFNHISDLLADLGDYLNK